ncbi:MAG: hypothetical protein WCS84_11720, partial [Nocardioides sp.]
MDLELDGCSNAFGVAPCAATGEPCYRTWATCLDTTNYAATTKTYRFTMANGHDLLPSGLQAWPCITQIGLVPAVIDMARGLGSRPELSVVMQDFV